MSLICAHKSMHDVVQAFARDGLGACGNGPAPDWDFELTPGGEARATIAVAPDWVRLAAPLPEPLRAQAPWKLLMLHDRMPGPCKVGLLSREHDESKNVRLESQADHEDEDVRLDSRADHEDEDVRLLLDIPLAQRSDVAERCRGGMATLQAIWTGLREGTPPDQIAPATSGPGNDTHPSQRHALPDMLCELLWPYTPRDGGRVAVELEAGGRRTQALIDPLPEGGALLWSPLLRERELPAERLAALATFLLRASGALRLVRPAVKAEAERPAQIGFEVQMRAPVTAPLLDEALRALATAGWLCERELRALTDERIAMHYASLWCPA